MIKQQFLTINVTDVIDVTDVTAVTVVTDDSPPETGASMNTAPFPAASAAMSCDTAGSMVLLSISSAPFSTELMSKAKY